MDDSLNKVYVGEISQSITFQTAPSPSAMLLVSTSSGRLHDNSERPKLCRESDRIDHTYNQYISPFYQLLDKDQ